MSRKITLLVCVICMLVSVPAQAQRWTKLKKPAGQTLRKPVGNPVARQHARALNELKLTRLEEEIFQASTRCITLPAAEEPRAARGYPKRVRSHPRATPKTPAQWLSILEDFIQQHGRYPGMSQGQEEKVLYTALQSVLDRLDDNDPIAQRIRQLRAQYPRKPNGKTPQQTLEELEEFITQHNYFPFHSASPLERALYTRVQSVLDRLDDDDPITQRIRQLRQEYRLKTR